MKVVLFVVMLAASSSFRNCLSQQLPEDSTSKAVVHIRVDTAYDDSKKSLMMLEIIGRYAPARVIHVVSGDTIASLFVREYGFGMSDLPKSYALLVDIILSKNHLTLPEDLRPGTLIIPSVPKRVLMGYNRTNPFNAIANMTAFVNAEAASSVSNREETTSPTDKTAIGPSAVAFMDSASVGTRRPTAPSEFVAFDLPLSPARDLIASTAFPAGTVSLETFPLPLKLATDERCDIEPISNDHQTLTQDQKSRLSDILKTQTRRAPLVFILDTGWPSLTAYNESRNALYDVLDKVWLGKFGTPFTRMVAQKSIPPANNEHCRCIERALRELQNLEAGVPSNQRIKTIYIPLTREQGAATILIDLLQTSNLLQRLQDNDNAAISESTIHGSRLWATRLVKQYFPAKWTGEEVNTDKSVLDAILLVGQAYAELSNTIFVVNESWTVSHGGKYYVQYQTPQFGIVTSAAGNDGTTHLLDFAQRSANTKDTMAIINMTSSGVVPQSTRIDKRDIDVAMVAGFDGSVTDDVSGTSFSSPRIGWFIAAGEAVRKNPVDLQHWGIDLQAQLKNIRDPQATDYQKLLFDPVRYLEAQAQLSQGGNVTPVP